MTVRFKANTANTGAATLNVNTLGAIAILRPNGDALLTGDIVANQTVEVIYRGGSFYMLSQRAQIQKYFFSTASRASDAASSTQTIAHGLGKTPSLIKVHAVQNTDGGGLAHSWGIFDGTTYACNAAVVEGGACGTIQQNKIVNIYDDTGFATTGQHATATLDSTNISLVWTKDGSPGSGRTIKMVIEAWE
jgi:hypothetical protein